MGGIKVNGIPYTGTENHLYLVALIEKYKLEI